MKYDAKNIIFGSGKIVLILSFIIAIELIILVDFYFNDIGLLIFAVLSWLIYLIPAYNRAKKYCNR
jgi:hypothetical protein